MERDWSKLGWAVVWIVLACLAVYYGFEHRRKFQRFQANAETTEGVVTHAVPGFKSRDDAEPPYIEYEFEVDGREYTGSSQVYIPEGDAVEVRYLPSDPRDNLAADHHDDGFFNRIFMAILMGGFGVFVGMLGYSEETAKRVNDSLKPTPFIRFPIVILCAASAYMLYNAPEQHPYSYYQILRWLVCGTAAMLAVLSHKWEIPFVPWLFGVAAILFNPLVPFHFARESWTWIDRLAALITIVAAFMKPGIVVPLAPKAESAVA